MGINVILGSDVNPAKFIWRTVVVHKRIQRVNINFSSSKKTWYSDVKIPVSNG